MALLAGLALEAYPLHSSNVPALDLGSSDEPLLIGSFADVVPEPSGLRTQRRRIARAAAAIAVRGSPYNTGASPVREVTAELAVVACEAGSLAAVRSPISMIATCGD